MMKFARLGGLTDRFGDFWDRFYSYSVGIYLFRFISLYLSEFRVGGGGNWALRGRQLIGMRFFSFLSSFSSRGSR